MGRRAGIAFGILLACCPCGFALNPSLDINQYAHTAWTVRDGFFKGAIQTIAQTPDGYLWLGTEFGLVRFDGVRSVPWSPPAGEHLPSNNILKLLVTRDGRLWIGTITGLSSWKDGKLTHYPELTGQLVSSLFEDRQGTTWSGSFGAPTGRLCAIRGAKVQCYGEDGSLGLGVLSLYEYRGDFWVGAATGLWRWKPGPPQVYSMPGPVPEISALIEGDNGKLWVALHGGIRQLVNGKAEPYPLPDGARFSPYRFLRDREGGLWVGSSSQGLLHLHQGRTDLFASAEGLSGENVNSLFEDREGNIWVATNDGLDRFRDFAVPTISFKQGLSGTFVGAVLVARDGSVWLGTSDGLSRWNDGQITIYRKPGPRSLTRTAQPLPTHEIYDRGLPDNVVRSLSQDDQGRIWVSTLRGIAYFEDGRFVPVSAVIRPAVLSIAAESAASLWLDDQFDGLSHLLDCRLIEEIPWAKLGRKDWSLTLLPDRARGGLWLGFYQSGVAYFKDGHIRASYAVSDGLGEGQVRGFQLDRDGTLWAATQGGLSRVKNGRVATLTSRNGLPCDTVHWVAEDNAHSFWLYMECGLARIARPELDAWAADPTHIAKATVFDSSDGVRSQSNAGGYTPKVAKSADGKLWFVTRGGVGVIDPRRLSFNTLPPPVHIEQVIADGKKSEVSSGLRLPALVRDVSVEYTALSFVAPEKVRFRYKLEGQDRDWTEVVNQRQVHYSNLRPRNYRFRVAASNNSGVWNETGASLDFSIDAAYYQTPWFRVACAGAFLVLLWALYRLRVHQLAREFNANLEGRVDERLRVARELHDTLLQSFHGLLPRLQAAVNLLPGRASDARQVLEAAVDDAAHAITEARDAVQDMRSSATTENDLAKAVEAMGQELTAHHRDATGDAPAFSLEVQGAAQDLHPILRDEIYRIVSEALRNAFHHAQARGIEVEIQYDPRQLRIRLRDDGIGIDVNVLRQEGREGHFGLRGMRERAKGIGGKLEIWSEQGAGTEVELIVPASVAYAGQAGRRSWLFRSRVRTNS